MKVEIQERLLTGDICLPLLFLAYLFLERLIQQARALSPRLSVCLRPPVSG
jgi:hypothetical protein